jgi:hypothetical protein
MLIGFQISIKNYVELKFEVKYAIRGSEQWERGGGGGLGSDNHLESQNWTGGPNP